MSAVRFTSAFAAPLEEYLEFKSQMGFYGQSRIVYLKRFDSYATRHDLRVFDRAAVEGWVTEELTRSSVHRSWMSYIRDFGRWLAIHVDPDAYVLSEQWKSPFIRTQPYLLAREEIDRFFIAAAGILAQSPWAWQAGAFFTLMHSCGLRTGEARALEVSQVDIAAGRLDIVGSKGRRSRRLPITDEVTAVLTECDQQSRTRFPTRERFFVSAAGTPVTPASVGVIFHRIWDAAGLPAPVQGKRPRPYDFRHHFAYANLERWMADGTDVTAMLPYLSRYMGHATFDSTYYYVHTSPDFMNAYADIAQEGHSLLPEVGFQ